MSMLCAVLQCQSGTGKKSGKPYNMVQVLQGSELGTLFADFPISPGLYSLDTSAEMKFGELKTVVTAAHLQAPLRYLAFDQQGKLDFQKSVDASAPGSVSSGKVKLTG